MTSFMHKIRRMKEETASVLEFCKQNPIPAFFIFYASYLLVYTSPPTNPRDNLGQHLTERADHILRIAGLGSLAVATLRKAPVSEEKDQE